MCGIPDHCSSTRVWFWTGWPAALSLHPLSLHLPTRLRPRVYRDCGESPLPNGSPLWTVELGARELAAARRGAHVLLVSRNTPRLWLYPAGCPRPWPAVLLQVLPWCEGCSADSGGVCCRRPQSPILSGQGQKCPYFVCFLTFFLFNGGITYVLKVYKS